MAQYTVSFRGGFSDRSGIKPENTIIQTKNFDNRTRIALINATSIILNKKYPRLSSQYVEESQTLIKRFWAEVYSRPIDWTELYSAGVLLSTISDTFLEDTYDAILSVIEYIVGVVDKGGGYSFYYEGGYYTAAQFYNDVFEKEYVGYRIIDKLIVPITDTLEADEILAAVQTPYTDVRQHINKSLHFLSDRDSPDYANSIKESISAVERMCSIIVGKSCTLGDALSKLQTKGIAINNQMKQAFEKLYAYTNGASGIRHAGELDGSDATFAEAKFMLVSCCAFVNYLTELMAKCP